MDVGSDNEEDEASFWLARGRGVRECHVTASPLPYQPLTVITRLTTSTDFQPASQPALLAISVPRMLPPNDPKLSRRVLAVASMEGDSLNYILWICHSRICPFPVSDFLLYDFLLCDFLSNDFLLHDFLFHDFLLYEFLASDPRLFTFATADSTICSLDRHLTLRLA